MSKAYEAAVRLLSRREHSVYELMNKLGRKGFSRAECEEALTRCQELGFQSDSRYVQSMLRHRIQQGYGPMRIRQDLQAAGIDSVIIDEALHAEAENWIDYARNLWEKKSGRILQMDWTSRQKLQRYLYAHGFSVDVINQVMTSE